MKPVHTAFSCKNYHHNNTSEERMAESKKVKDILSFVRRLKRPGTGNKAGRFGIVWISFLWNGPRMFVIRLEEKMAKFLE